MYMSRRQNRRGPHEIYCHEETECWRAGRGRGDPECRMEIEGDEGFQAQRMLTLMWRKLFLSEAKKMVSVCMKP